VQLPNDLKTAVTPAVVMPDADTITFLQLCTFSSWGLRSITLGGINKGEERESVYLENCALVQWQPPKREKEIASAAN
jgi:hypothetical protein